MRTDGLNNEQVMHAMGIDDAYRVERVLADRPGGVTELVTLDGAGPFVRRRIPVKLARRSVWGALSECHCARLPRVEATYEMPDEFVVVYDYVPGVTLEQLVDSRGRLPEAEAVKLVSEVCEATAVLHAHGIIHRDLSPANIIVAADGAHLIDFDIARTVVEGASRDTSPLGTPGFASPEQHGFAQSDARSDVYSIGRLLGYLLTGARPGVGDEYEGLLANEEVVSPALRSVVDRACTFDRGERYQSVEDLARALGGGAAAVMPTPDGGSAAQGEFAGALGKLYRWDVRLLRALKKPGRVKTLVIIGLIVLLLVNAAALGWAAWQAGLWPFQGVDQGADANGGGDAWSSVFSRPDPTDEPNGSDGPGSSQPTTQEASATLELVESGWSSIAGGYVQYALAIKNTDDTLCVDYPAVTITGRDEDGSVVFSEEMVFSPIGPGETRYFATQAGNGVSPATVEFDLQEPKSYALREASGRSVFSVSGVSEVTGSFGDVAFAGELTTEEYSDTDVLDMGDVSVVVVLRDEAGKIVCGYTDFVRRPEVGQTTSFEVPTNFCPDYASFEVYANRW